MQMEHQVMDILNASLAVRTVRELALKESVNVYLYGGALRDYFLGLTPTDLDFLVSTDAAEFAHKISVLVPGETRTFPSQVGDIGYYRGELGKLDFIPSKGLTIEEYLDRYLDFTINSLVFDVRDNKLLYFNNCKVDLRDRLIRTVRPAGSLSNPGNIPLRAVRLTLLTPDFSLDNRTYLDIKSNKEYVTAARPSRVGYELSNILESKEYLRGIQLLEDLGLLQQIFKTFLPCAHSDRQQEEHSTESPLSDILRMYKMIDDLISPFEAPLSKSLPTHALLLRLVVLLLTRSRRAFLEMEESKRRAFLVAKGAQIEKNLFDLGVIPGRAFRVRIIAVGYLSGIASLLDRTAKLEEAVDLSMKTFGPWKGFLASVLICADWLCSKKDVGANPDDMKTAGEILRSKIALLEIEHGRG